MTSKESHMMVAPATLLKGSIEIPARWAIDKDRGISWTIAGEPHQDDLEMGGRQVAVIVRYGTDEAGKLQMHRHIVWPMLRTIPNDTYGSLADDFDRDVFPQIMIDGKLLEAESPRRICLRGLLTIDSTVFPALRLTRTIFPSTCHPAVIENCTLTNTSDRACEVEISKLSEVRRTDPAKGVLGEYILQAQGFGAGNFTLRPGQAVNFSVVFSGRKGTEELIQIDPMLEQKAREGYVDDLWEKLRFECPDPVLEREFAFCKVRAAESIYETKAGLMHSPGGGPYYAAIWANDQGEYASPFFPFLGDFAGNESALNAYRHFARFMNTEYSPIPCSIVAEGTDIWNGEGDRGDAAMIAYGASRFALARGDQKIAEELWPLIEWCLEYCKRKTNTHGVVESDCDELENRFPAGDANLCTSSLTYDALHSATYLAAELGKSHTVIEDLNKRADELHKAIEKHFGATVEGFDTYRYYDGNTTLRAWICIPLAMGIFDRKDATINALFSPRLWTKDGLATEAGNETFWDRSTLYGMRGVFAAGETERALEYLTDYSKRRLLGEHVPYPVEAWPDGDQRHLSAESALYCRVITEGLFGIRPTGFREFRITPRLPKEWNRMALRKVHGFGNVFDIEVTQHEVSQAVSIVCEHGEAEVCATVDGITFTVRLPE